MARAILLCGLLALGLLATTAAAGDVVQLNPASFKAMLSDDAVWIVKFYGEHLLTLPLLPWLAWQ